ncbi:WxL protein peptidoglycan domain-containing protein [Streptomyces sp. NPDC055254]
MRTRTHAPRSRRRAPRARAPRSGLLVDRAALPWLRGLPWLLGLLGLLLAGAGPARAADNGTWGVFPTPPAGAAMSDRAYFFHQGAAGTTVDDSVTILNSSDTELTFQVFATDAVNTPSGGAFALLPVETEPQDVGAWIALPPETASTVTVPAKGRKDVPFTVKVPADATPGDHVGGIVALNTAVEGVQQEGKVKVGVKRSVGARLYFRVPGPVTPGLSVEDVRVNRSAPLLPWVGEARATLSYTLVNRGNVAVEPRVAFSAEGLFGRAVLDRPARESKPVLLPGQRVELTEPWLDAPQLDWVDVEVVAGAAAHPDLRSASGTGFLAVPWPAAGAVLVLAGAGLALRAVRRRRRSRDTGLPEPQPYLAATR